MTMPNNVTNVVIFHGDEQRIREILEAIQMEDIGPGSIDFDKVILMPPSLNIECGSRTEQGLKLYTSFVKQFLAEVEAGGSTSGNRQLSEQYHKLREDEAFRLGEQAYHNLQEYGHATWYSWSNEHWATKWNAYGFEYLGEPEAGTVRFYTAWAPPHPVLEKLAERYPEIGFTHRWADEDIERNCGEREYKPGGQMEEYIPLNESKEAYELAADIQRSDLSEYGLFLTENGDGYEYREEEEQDITMG